MSVAQPSTRAEARSSLFARRRHRSTTPEPATSQAAPAAVVPGTRTPVGLPRDLVVDESGKPRRSVLLAAIMIRRGRSVADIAQATGLSPEVVTCLSRSL